MLWTRMLKRSLKVAVIYRVIHWSLTDQGSVPHDRGLDCGLSGNPSYLLFSCHEYFLKPQTWNWPGK